MHSNNELCKVERAAAFDVGKTPYLTENLVRQPSFFEHLSRSITWNRIRYIHDLLGPHPYH